MAALPRSRAGCATTLAAIGDLMWLREGYGGFLSEGTAAALRRCRGLVANLETPIDPHAPVRRWVLETLRYNAPAEYLEPLAGLGLDAIALSLCNNHALDQRAGGLARTREVVRGRGITCLGGAGGRDDAADRIEVGGVRIALFATTFGINHDQARAPAGVPVVAFGDRRRATDWRVVEQLVARARAYAPELVVAVPHWGFEYEYWPDAAMRAAAAGLVERGVDLVIGSSPHVLQPVDVISVDGWDPRAPTQVRRGGPPRAALVAYSLGNFATVMPTQACRVGGVLEIGLRREAHGGLSPLPLGFRPTVSVRGTGHPLAMRTHTLAEHGLSSPHPLRALPEPRATT
jgi:poly-gamma-glutamate synthesis protein (capsule biosynthesis protein)